MRGKITLIGCPKLDDVDYSEKLTQILRQNDIKSVTDCAHGSALLRRAGKGCENGPAEQRRSSSRGRWSHSRWTEKFWTAEKRVIGSKERNEEKRQVPPFRGEPAVLACVFIGWR